MTNLELKSEKREVFGKKIKSLRNKGLLPAVVYGGREGSVPILVNLKDFKKVFKIAGETALIRLFVDNAQSSAKNAALGGGQKPALGFKNVLIYDIDRNAVTDEINHVDFREVKMDEKIIAKVPIIFTGDSLAVSDLGGVLVKAMQEIEIRALPSDLPRQIEVDISSLKTFDDSIALKDVKLPKNVEMLGNPSASVASVAPPRSEEELEALSGEVQEKVEEVAVETEEKAEERAKEKEKEKEEPEK